MTDLNEKLKLVAEYDGFKEIGTGSDKHYKKGKQIVWELDYHRIYDWQIPVWQKVCKESIDIEKSTDDIRQFMLFKEKYCKHICYGTPLESFEILVQAIQFINKMKK